jgi:hypothetical protein
MINLVRSATTYTDGGYYAALVYDAKTTTVTQRWKLINPFKSLDTDTSSTDQYEIYTTKGTLALTVGTSKSQAYTTTTGTDSEANHKLTTHEVIFGFASKEIIMTVPLANAQAATAVYSGSVSCEHIDQQTYPYCLNKTDIFTMLAVAPGNVTLVGNVNVADYAATRFAYNPPYINLYKAEKLYSKSADFSMYDLFGASTAANGITFTPSGVDATSAASTGINRIVSDISTNWASSLVGKGTTHPIFQLYKFIPAASSSYNYVDECSNRGICDYTTGVCSCFPGYSNDACQEQNSLAV